MIRSGFSFRSAVGTVDEVISRLKETGTKYAPLADWCSTFGFGYWIEAAKKEGLKSILGVTIPVTEALQAKKPISSDTIFLAKGQVEPINLLVNKASTQFRYTYLLKYEDVANLEGVVTIFGHTAKLDKIDATNPDVYIGLTAACSKGFLRKARELGFKFVASSLNRYPRPEDAGFYEVLVGRGASLQTYDQHILSDEEWIASVKDIAPDIWEEALENRNKVFEECNSVFPKGEVLQYEADKDLRSLCVEGAQKIGVDLSDPVYAERLETELRLIEEKGYTSYFHIVADLMTYARSQMLMGTARGSSASSLVAYLTGITAMDPIKWNLLLFRFIDPERNDPLDIDIDANFAKSNLLVEYLSNKYGKERVAALGTVAYYQEKSALEEVSKALGAPVFDTKKVLDVVEHFAAGDSRSDTALKVALETTTLGKNLVEKYPGLEIAGRMGGHPRHSSTHAAGILITDKPVSHYVAVDARTNTSQNDKFLAEKQGLLKLDLLSLKQLAIYEDCLSMAGLPFDFLDTIPMDDQGAFDVLNKGNYVGTFQFSGGACKGLSREVKIESVLDISAVSSNARPGPLASGAAKDWVKRKRGDAPVTYLHPSLEPYLKSSLGLLCWQEQIMQAAHFIAGLPWPMVTKLRRAVGKSMGPEAMREYSEPLKNGLLKAGWTQEQADTFWKDILGYSKYGFPASHSHSYAVVTYQGLYLKHHYPLEYAAACLQYRDDPETQLEILRELDAMGIKYIPVDAELSTDRWRVVTKDGKKVLVGALSLLVGAGPKLVSQVMSARARSEPLPEKAQKLLANPKTKIDSLTPIATAIAKLDTSRAIRPETRVTALADVQPDGFWQDGIVVVGVAEVIKERSENEKERMEARKERGQAEVYKGPDKYLEVRLRDDTESNFLCKIGAKDYAQLAPKVIDGKPGKSVYAMKITITPEIKMGLVKAINAIGEISI